MRKEAMIVLSVLGLMIAVGAAAAFGAGLSRFPQLPVPQLHLEQAREALGMNVTLKDLFAIEEPLHVAPQKPHEVRIYAVVSKTARDTTAYVAGDPQQTADDPCTSADGTNICRELARGEKICAANFVPLGTQLYIEGFGICTVKDRMSSRYKNRVDLAMHRGGKADALQWGRKSTTVHILR